jgi:hypothetical protein
MQRPPHSLRSWAPAGVGAFALLGLVGVPVEITLRLVEHPVVAPPLVTTVLLVGSCLLLMWSGLGLRRLAGERALARRPTPGL